MRSATYTKLWLIGISLSIVGLVDTLYLSYVGISQTTVVCVAGSSCNSVLGSVYSSVGGLPLALIGFLYYLILLAEFVYLKEGSTHKARLVATTFSGIGFVISLFLVYLQFFVLQAICEYCMLSALLTTGLFITSIMLLKTNKKRVANNEKHSKVKSYGNERSS